jgi:hypothetical protein
METEDCTQSVYMNLQGLHIQQSSSKFKTDSTISKHSPSQGCITININSSYSTEVMVVVG